MSETLIPKTDGDLDQPKIMETNQSDIVNAPVVDAEKVAAPKEDDVSVCKDQDVSASKDQDVSASKDLDEQAAGDVCLTPKPGETVVKKSEIDEILSGKNVASGDEPSPAMKDKLPVADSKDENSNELIIKKLQQVVQKTSEERNLYQKKLENTEKQLACLQASFDALLKGGGDDENSLRCMVEQLKNKLVQASLQLEDRTRTVATQEKQISALNTQVASLKEVESLTRNILQMRNVEVNHLQADLYKMEDQITNERKKYNTMISKMDAAVKLNADLKKEYETQLRLFRDIQGKYEEKVTLLSQEKQALETSQIVPKENIV